MKALVVDPHGSLSLGDVPRPELPGECLVRVRMAGICGTDLELLKGYAGFHGIPGHEFVGTVESVPAGANPAWVGQRVVGDINVGCGACEFCRDGVKEHCLNRTVVGIRGRGGAFAEWLSLPAVNLHHLPESLDDAAAVFVEPVAAACRMLEQVAFDGQPAVAVIGDGRMGLISALVLKTATPDVTVLGRHDRKLDVARALGVAAGPADAAANAAFDVVVDATGRPEGLRRALELVRPRGTVILKSTFHGEAALESWPIVVNEVSIVGSRCGPFEPAIALLAAGAIDVSPLVSRLARIEDFESAFADARQSLKVLFDLR